MTPFLTCDWMMPLVGEYLDIYDLTRFSMTCLEMYQDPALYSIFLQHQTTILDTFTFLLVRYQQFVHDLRHVVVDEENVLELETIEDQLDHSWSTLTRFVLEIRKQPSHQRIKGRGLLEWDIYQDQGHLDMSTFMRKCQQTFLLVPSDDCPEEIEWRKVSFRPLMNVMTSIHFRSENHVMVPTSLYENNIREYTLDIECPLGTTLDQLHEALRESGLSWDYVDLSPDKVTIAGGSVFKRPGRKGYWVLRAPCLDCYVLQEEKRRPI